MHRILPHISRVDGFKMQNSQNNWGLWLIEKVLPWVTLGYLLLSIGVYFFYVPYIGFNFDPNTGQITIIHVSTTDESSVQIGDKIIQFGNNTMVSFIQNPRQKLIDKHPVGTPITISLERDGERLEIPWQYFYPSSEEVIDRINNNWWLPLIYWLAGLSIIFLVRPKNTRWYLLILFN